MSTSRSRRKSASWSVVGWSKMRVGGRSIPVVAVSRLPNSTAVRESNPSSWNGWSGEWRPCWGGRGSRPRASGGDGGGVDAAGRGCCSASCRWSELTAAVAESGATAPVGGVGMRPVSRGLGRCAVKTGRELLPVDVGDGDGGVVVVEGVLQGSDGEIRVERMSSRAGCSSRRRPRRRPCPHRSRAPRRCWWRGVPDASVFGEGVEVGVGGGVGGLPTAAPGGRAGGEEDEGAEVEVLGQLMEMRGGECLGSKDLVDVREVDLRERGVLRECRRRG